MQRRTFLKQLAGTGALIAVSDLPAFSTEKSEKFFPQRGKFERLTLRYATVKIGLEKPFSVLHISDTHLAEAYSHESGNKRLLSEKRNTTFGGFQETALADTLAWAKQNVDFVIHTGDLIDWQSEANFDLVRKYFGNALFGSLGNHEYSPDMWLSEPKESHDEGFKDLTREKLQNVFPFDVRLASQVVNGVNFVTLDDVYGYVTESQVEAFRKEAAKKLPIVLCMHVPFYTEELWRTNVRFWSHANEHFTSAEIPTAAGDYKAQQDDKVTADFIKYLKKEPLLKAILAGHVHFFHDEQFSRTARQYTTGPNYLFSGEEILFI